MNKQYTIRNVTPQLDAKLRAKAARERVSLNTALLKALDQGVQSSTKKRTKHHDFDDLAGSWAPDLAFDAAMQDVRQIHERDWR